jgi:hypothetical protein
MGVGFSNIVHLESGSSVVYLPFGVNYLLGKDKKHYFEIGGGVTQVFNSNPEGESPSAISQTFAHLVLGYRYQPIKKGFSFRAFICPVYGGGVFIPYYVGSIRGYKF